MAAVSPGLTSLFQAGRTEDDMEVKVTGSFLARIYLLEVRVTFQGHNLLGIIEDLLRK